MTRKRRMFYLIRRWARMPAGEHRERVFLEAERLFEATGYRGRIFGRILGAKA